MAGNTFGKIYTLTSFGESHGKAIGGIIDGCPSNIPLDLEQIQLELDRRKPGQSKIVTQRKEADKVDFLSGIFEGKTLGTPIGFIIPNSNQHSKDYDHIKDVFRPSHADYTYQVKYGHRDHRGGGRSSARETAVRVVGGAVAKQVLALKQVEVFAFVNQVGAIELKENYQNLTLQNRFNNNTRCPDEKTASKMEELILQTRKKGDTIGGVITCVIKNVPAGLGAPVYDKLEADLAKAMMSINAAKGFEYGSGFEGVKQPGSLQNDIFDVTNNKVITKTNNSGGIQGGISNGMDIYFKVAFKSVATIMQEQETIDKKLNKVNVKGKGRHDPCVLPRAVSVVEAMSAMVILDHLLLDAAYNLFKQ